ncbi:hypothetical protein E4P39_01295 [Blastococcus sp. CT_GayMR19]|uniref:hypothetical protein n=1 Tax=Blastococcus sp. CT_GayMR19 TaxID=2559608 RepID=UPI0010733320|nr:hypothetical protein [Blastococcus sp. CT_GayMR19]TFV79313.1 hypothetical protein E4P39_01295 [Blastococcus sp. CT_GayMR19]
MGSPSREQHYRIIEPLLEAGLELEQVRALLFRLAFDAIVGAGSTSVGGLTELVRDQPAEVQAAWLRALGEMIALGTSTPPGP